LISLNLKFSSLEGATMQPLLYQANLNRGLILAHEFHYFLMAEHSLAVKSSRTIDDISLDSKLSDEVAARLYSANFGAGSYPRAQRGAY
jgi:hypothetical protein